MKSKDPGPLTAIRAIGVRDQSALASNAGTRSAHTVSALLNLTSR